MQILSQPLYYNFNRSDIGRIVLFHCKKENVLHPFLIVFNNSQNDEDDSDILFKHQLTNKVWDFHEICLAAYEYTIIKDTRLST